MAINDSFEADATGVADDGDFIIDGSSADTGAAEVFELGGSDAAKVYREVDIDGDGTWEISVLIDSTTDVWHSQKNQLVVSQSNNVRIRIVNTSGGPADFYSFGMEVDD